MRKAKTALFFVALCLIWGSTWSVIKVGYGDLGPFNAAALRFLIAGPLLLAALPVLRIPWPTGGQWRTIALVGLLTFTVNYACVYWGEQSIDSGLAAVLFATSPIVTVVLAHWLLPDERLTPRRAVGAILAFAGVLVLMGDEIRVDLASPLPMVALLVAGSAAGLGNVLARRDARSLHPAALTAFGMTIGGLLLTLVSLAAGERFGVPSDGETWAAVIYLSAVGSVAGFVILFGLLQRLRAAAVSYVHVVMPVIALLIGSVALRERPTLGVLLGAAIIVVATLVANWTPPRRATQAGTGATPAGLRARSGSSER